LLPAAKNISDEICGAKGHHLCENGEHVWDDLARKISTIAAEKGYISANPAEMDLNKDEALEVAGFEMVSSGWNLRGKAERLRKEKSIEQDASCIIEAERARLQAKAPSSDQVRTEPRLGQALMHEFHL
jgi:hypothetical protein